MAGEDKPRCGAKTRKGTPCTNPPVTGRKRCRMHGGATPRGIASVHTKTGARSLDLPTRYMAEYERSLGDPDQLNLSDKIAAADAREQELRRRLSTGESGELWKSVAILAGAMKDALDTLSSGDGEGNAEAELRRLVERLKGTTETALADEQTWAAIIDLQDHAGKMREREGKRRVQMQELFTKEQGRLLIGAVTGAVKRHVSDPRIRAAIATDLARLVAPGHGSGVEPAAD